MDGDGRCSSPTRPTNRSPRTSRKTAWAATSRHRRRIGCTAKAIQFSPQSEQHDATGADFRKCFKGDDVMRKYLSLLVLVVGVVLIAMSSSLLNTSRVAAETQQSIAVFDSDGRLKLPNPAIFRRWVLVGTPLTPDGLNNGKAGFPEYHNVYIEEKNVDVYLKTGSFPEGTVIVKELARVLNPTFPDGSRTEPSGPGYFNGEFNGIDLTLKDSKRFAKTNGWGFFTFGHHPLPLDKTSAENPVP